MSKSSSGKRKLILFTLTGIISIMILSPFLMATLFFPAEIHLIKGEEHVFQFNIPIEANVIGKDKLVLNINDQPVSENINIDLSQQFSVQSDQSGIINVQLKLFGLIPLKVVKVDVLSNVQLIPCGNTIGVRISTDGVMVLGTGQVNCEDGKAYEPGKGIIKSGDLILQANAIELNNKEELIEQVEGSEGKAINLKIKRDEEIIETSIVAVKSIDDKAYKIGVWVRDSTQGIGTVTYYNPQTGNFGALGHGILDVDTNKLMTVRQGDITASKITSVKKGKKGSPGEIVGTIIGETVLGNIKINTQYGIYGVINSKMSHLIQDHALTIGIKQEVRAGQATIRTNIIDNEIREYDIVIQSVNRYSSDDSKGMIIKITDAELLKDTNGIVQGMSGSPIIQDGKLIGAVTHVFVQDPTKGYGIFIENMLKQEEKIN